jgi:hypothetical protein
MVSGTSHLIRLHEPPPAVWFIASMQPQARRPLVAPTVGGRRTRDLPNAGRDGSPLARLARPEHETVHFRRTDRCVFRTKGQGFIVL